MSFYNSVCYFLHAPKPLMKRFKRQAVFLATNLETWVWCLFLVSGPCSTKCYLSALELKLRNFWFGTKFSLAHRK